MRPAFEFEWDVQPAGIEAMETHGDVLPQATLDSVKANGVGLKGPITTPIGAGSAASTSRLRHALNLYANLRPGKTIKGVQAPFEHVDLVVVRENLEGMYSGIEFDTGTPEATEVIDFINARSKRQIEPDAALSIKLITPENTERIVRYAFDYARANNRKKVTIVHKANIMKFTDGLFLSVAQEVASEYPDIESNDRIIDNMCMQLMQKPDEYDVLVMANLYGDIVSDLVAGMIGGLGRGAERQHRHRGSGLRADPRFCPEPCRQERGQSDGDDPLGRNDASASRRDGRGRAGRAAVAGVIADGDRVTYDLRADRDPSKAATHDRDDRGDCRTAVAGKADSSASRNPLSSTSASDS